MFGYCSLVGSRKVFIVGDLNARIGQMQFQPIMHDEMDKGEAIEVDASWFKVSEDEEINPQGRALRCYLASGGFSVLDYALAHIDALSSIKSFKMWPG